MDGLVKKYFYFFAPRESTRYFNQVGVYIFFHFNNEMQI